MSYPDKIKLFMKIWKIATSDSIRLGAFAGESISENTFKQSLKRLRKAKALFSSRISKSFLHFDASLKKRWEYFESLEIGQREQFKSRSGILHHLDSQMFALHFIKVFGEWRVMPNVFSEHHVSTIVSEGSGNQKYAPDLVLSRKCGMTLVDTILYVEIERSLKAANRYIQKWLAYEQDENVSGVLYVVSRPDIYLKLIALLNNYFSRSVGANGFTIFILQVDETVKQDSLNCLVKVFEFGSVRLDLLSSVISSLKNRLLRVEIA